MQRKGFRFPIFWQILGGCVALSGLLILASYVYARHKAMAETQTRWVEAHLLRYQRIEEALGKSAASVTDIVAHDLALRRAMSPWKGDGFGAGALLGGMTEGEASGPQLTATEVATARAKEMYEALQGESGLRPELFVVFDVNGNAVFVPEKDAPVKPGELRQLEALGKVRAGNSYYSRLMFQSGHVFQVSGVPIQRWGGQETVGGVLIGIDVERYFEEYRRQEPNPARQGRLAIIRNGEIVDASFPRELWPDIVESLRKDRRQVVREGNSTMEVAVFDKQQWDFQEAQIGGFVGSEQTPSLGSLIMMRPHVAQKKPEGFAMGIILGLGLAIAIASVLAAIITRPLKRLVRATAEIASGGGDLTKRVANCGNNELGDLAINLNGLFSNLQGLAKDVQGASFQVGASSAEISAASKQMLDGAKDQAMKMESSTAAVTELSTSIQQVAQNAVQATKVAKQSNDSVAQAIDSMGHIRQTVEEAGEKIHELGESSKRIGNIVEVIRQISEQTSLLALNASIEAAHAGEQGRGFAVVADEVSSLAKRVGQSAKDIEDLIATIKDQTSAAVTTMQAGTREVESGSQLVANTLGNLKQIIDVVQDTANAVQEQAIVSDEIARNMDAVQKIANEVLHASEEAVIQGEQLHTLAFQLERSVRNFNVDGETHEDDVESPRNGGGGQGRNGDVETRTTAVRQAAQLPALASHPPASNTRAASGGRKRT
jgi:methyl-accepting chemotaxis protein